MGRRFLVSEYDLGRGSCRCLFRGDFFGFVVFGYWGVFVVVVFRIVLCFGDGGWVGWIVGFWVGCFFLLGGLESLVGLLW